MRVLAIDDDHAAPVLFGAIARRMGIEIVTTGDCLSALSLLKSSDFDVIIMDLNLNGVTGFECTRLCREWQSQSGRRQPIIAVTGWAEKEDRDMCLRSGMDDYLSKPYQIKELTAMIDKWSPKKVSPTL